MLEQSATGPATPIEFCLIESKTFYTLPFRLMFLFANVRTRANTDEQTTTVAQL